MTWERRIPFGYRMEKAAIVCEQAEAEVVKLIFTLYLDGSSLKQIAEEMMRRGIRYHQENPEWNKSTVKRILENRRYLGDEVFPGIISEEDFSEAQSLKQRKNVYAPCPIRVAAIQDKLVCNNCGGPLKRTSAGNGKAQWKCLDSQCGNTVRFRDEELGERLERCLRTAAGTPEILCLRRSARQPGLEVLRLENELNAALNRSNEDREYLTCLIYALAAERYKCLSDDTAVYKTMKVYRKAETGDWEALRELLEITVNTVCIGKDRTLSLRLKNGLTITEEGEVREA